MIIAVEDATYAVAKRKLEKLRPADIRTLMTSSITSAASWELQGSVSHKARKRSGPKANLKSKPVG